VAVTREGNKQRGRRLVLASGDTRFWVVPFNRVAQLSSFEVDTSQLSGLFGIIQVDIRDSYAPTGGSSTTVIRKSFAVKAGDALSVVLDGEYQLIGGIDLRTNFSGPIVSLAASFR